MIRLTSKTKVTHADSDVSKYYNQLQKYENLEKSPEELEEVLKERYCEVACTSESAHDPRDRGQWFATSCNFGCSKLDLQRWVYCPKCGKKTKGSYRKSSTTKSSATFGKGHLYSGL